MKSLEQILKPGDLIVAKEDKLSQRMFNLTNKICYIPGQTSMVLAVAGMGLHLFDVELLTKEKKVTANLGQETFFRIFDILPRDLK